MATKTAVLPGLASLGQKTAGDAAAAGIPPIQLKRDLSGVEAYQALKHLPKGTTEASVRSDAKALAENPDLNQLSFLELIRQYDVQTTPGLDEMLDSVRARKAGEAGERVVMIVSKCGDFNRRMPKPNPKFVEKFKKGVVTAREILDNVKWLGGEIEKARLRFSDMLTLVEREEQYHMGQSNLSVEACARDLTISGQEDEREDRLITVTALLEVLQEELASRLAGELDEDERTRFQNVSVLVVARIKNLKPMIAKANMAAKRFAMQSNANALTALDQYDFATAGIAAWKADIVGELDAQANMAMNMAYLQGVKFTEAQAMATADAFDAQMQSMAEMLTTQLNSLEVIERVTTSLVNAGQTMARALETAQTQSVEAAKVIEKSRNDVEKAELQLSADMQRILKGAAA